MIQPDYRVLNFICICTLYCGFWGRQLYLLFCAGFPSHTPCKADLHSLNFSFEKCVLEYVHDRYIISGRDQMLYQ
jgi:hypothetical protein